MHAGGSNWSILKARDFRRFFMAQCFSLAGDATGGTALVFAVAAAYGARALSLLLTARLVALLVFLPLGGAVADRWPRPAIMRGTDLVRLMTQGATAAALLTGHAPLLALACAQFVHGAASALFTPAVSGLIRDCVAEESRQSANALRSLVQSAATLLGPLAAVILVEDVGAGWGVAADSLSFAFSALCLVGVRAAKTTSSRPSRVGLTVLTRDVVVGWREFAQRRWIRNGIMAASVVNMLSAALGVLGPVESLRGYGGPGLWGLFLTSLGAGTALGSLTAMRLKAPRPLLTGFVAFAVCGLAPMTWGLGAPRPAILLSALAAGFGLMVFNPLWESAMQAQLPTDLISRVSACEWLGSYLAQPLGLLFAGLLAGDPGRTRIVLLGIGVGQILAALAPLTSRTVRDLRVYQKYTEKPQASAMVSS